MRSALLRCFDAEDVLMLFTYTENPPENRFLAQGSCGLAVVVQLYGKQFLSVHLPPALLRLGPLP